MSKRSFRGELTKSMVELVDRVLRGLKVPLRAFFVARLKAKGGGGTPRLALLSVGSFCFLFGSDVISLD